MKIELRHVSLTYDETPVLQQVEFTAEHGDFLTIEGPSGSGKSSLLRLINRLQEPTSGEILADDRPIREYDVTALRRRIGYVQQTPVMLEASVLENLHLPFRFRAARDRPKPSESVLRAEMDAFLLDGVDLESNAVTLSVGQKQRLAFIRVLLGEPSVLLCDEPTSALDAESSQIVIEALERLNRERQITILLVTHQALPFREIEPRRFYLENGGTLREVSP